MDTGDEREVMDGPPEGSEVPDLTPIPEMYAPGVNAEDIEDRREDGHLAAPKELNLFPGPATIAGPALCTEDSG